MTTITEITNNFVSDVVKLDEGINVENNTTCTNNINFVLWQLQSIQ